MVSRLWLGPNFWNHAYFTGFTVYSNRLGISQSINIEPIIAHLNQSSSLGDRPSDVEACMSANQEMRESYWGAYPSLESSTMKLSKKNMLLGVIEPLSIHNTKIPIID